MIAAVVHHRKEEEFDQPKPEKIKRGYIHGGMRSSEASDSHAHSFDYDTSDSISEEEEDVEVCYYKCISNKLYLLDFSHPAIIVGLEYQIFSITFEYLSSLILTCLSKSLHACTVSAIIFIFYNFKMLS